LQRSQISIRTVQLWLVKADVLPGTPQQLPPDFGAAVGS
jgi:hypothetical protein